MTESNASGGNAELPPLVQDTGQTGAVLKKEEETP